MKWITLKSHTFQSTQSLTGKPNGSVMNKSKSHTSSYSAQGPEPQLLHITSLVRSQLVVDPRFVDYETCPLRIWEERGGKKHAAFLLHEKAVLTTKWRQGNMHIIKQTKRRYCTPIIWKTQIIHKCTVTSNYDPRVLRKIPVKYLRLSAAANSGSEETPLR
jgi:hypothetical protein